MASLFGGKAIYQMTGGPIQIVKGGFRSENPLLRATGGPSWLQEKLLFSLVRCFDVVVVRGSKARDFVYQNRLSKNCFIITGAMDTDRFKPDGERDIDVIYVARLIENKGHEEYLSAIKLLHKSRPDIKASIVGDGPLRTLLEQTVNSTGINNNVCFHGKLKDVVPVLQKSKIYVLLSATEGMSIAMLEAMAVGLPVVVHDVGDLSDAIKYKNCGVLIDNVEPANVASEIERLLDKDELWEEYSRSARQTIVEQYSVEAISNRWQHELGILLR